MKHSDPSQNGVKESRVVFPTFAKPEAKELSRVSSELTRLYYNNVMPDSRSLYNSDYEYEYIRYFDTPFHIYRQR
jgi:hypothetical protein